MDYSGSTVPVIDAETGEARQAQLFVAVLGASNYTFAEATWTQSLSDWLGSHRRALAFFGSCPGSETLDTGSIVPPPLLLPGRGELMYRRVA